MFSTILSFQSCCLHLCAACLEVECSDSVHSCLGLCWLLPQCLTNLIKISFKTPTCTFQAGLKPRYGSGSAIRVGPVLCVTSLGSFLQLTSKLYQESSIVERRGPAQEPSRRITLNNNIVDQAKLHRIHLRITIYLMQREPEIRDAKTVQKQIKCAEDQISARHSKCLNIAPGPWTVQCWTILTLM